MRARGCLRAPADGGFSARCPSRGVSPAPFPHQMIPTPPSRRLQRGSARPAVAPGPGDRDRGGSGAVPARCQAPAPRGDRRSPFRDSKEPLRPSGHPSGRPSVSPGREQRAPIPLWQRPSPRPCPQELGERPPHTHGHPRGLKFAPFLGSARPRGAPTPLPTGGCSLGSHPGRRVRSCGHTAVKFQATPLYF